MNKRWVELHCPRMMMYEADVSIHAISQVEFQDLSELGKEFTASSQTEKYWSAERVAIVGCEFIEVETTTHTRENLFEKKTVWREVNYPKGLQKLKRILQMNISRPPVHWRLYQ